MPDSERPLTGTLRALSGERRGALAGGVVLALLLAVPDLGRQLLVRDDPSRLHALAVDAVGVLTAGAGQVMLVAAVAGLSPGRWLPGGARLTVRALRASPGVLLAGLLMAGAVSALLTVPPSVAALGVGQVVGPLRDPSIGALLVATASDAVATALTAPYFALLAAALAGRPQRTAGQR